MRHEYATDIPQSERCREGRSCVDMLASFNLNHKKLSLVQCEEVKCCDRPLQPAVPVARAN